MKNTTKILIKGAIINCGIATALINGSITYFTLVHAISMTSSELLVNFFSTALGCGVICPFFGGLILKGVAAKNELDFGRKSEQFLAKFVPNNLFLGAIVIGLLDIFLLWLVPYVVLSVFNIKFTLVRIAWVILLAVYSGVAASIAAYFGMKRAHYSKKIA